MGQPEIMYEEIEGGITSKLPFIPVAGDQKMPDILFIFESRETGEFETVEGDQQFPVVQMDLHQYANMTKLKSELDSDTFDRVRVALGLETLAIAKEKGEKISQSARKNLE